MTILLKAVVLFVVTYRSQIFSKISAEAMISSRRMKITIGNNNEIQPHATIVAKGGPIEIGNHNIIEERAVIFSRGKITIDNNNEIGPHSAIVADAGPIEIGNKNTLKERTVILNSLCPVHIPSSTPVLYIGNNNFFGVGSHSEALKIGNNNTFQSKCFVGSDVEVTDNNTVSAGCRLTCPEVVGPNAVTCGHPCTRRN